MRIAGGAEASEADGSNALARAVAENRWPADRARIKGIACLDDGQIVAKQAAATVKNLDAIVPDWALLNWKKYIYTPLGVRVAVANMARGCPFTCSFCSQWKFWRDDRVRDPKRVVDEVEDLVTNHGLVHVSLGTKAAAQLKLDLFIRETTVAQNNEAIRLLREADIFTEALFHCLWRDAGFRRRYLLGCLKAVLKAGAGRTFHDLGNAGYWGPQSKDKVDFHFDGTRQLAEAQVADWDAAADGARKARERQEAVLAQMKDRVGDRHARMACGGGTQQMDDFEIPAE